MSVVVSLPFNSTFDVAITVNADWIQSCTIVDSQSLQVYGPFNGQGTKEIGKFRLSIPSGTNPQGYLLRVIVTHHDAQTHEIRENSYKVIPLGGALYLTVNTEDMPQAGGDLVDWNDCIVAFRKA